MDDWVINVHWGDFSGVYSLLPNLCRFFFHMIQMLLCYTITIKEHILGRYSEYDMTLLQRCDWLRRWFIWCKFGSQSGSSAPAARGPFPYAGIPHISTSLSPSCFLCFTCPFPLSSLLAFCERAEAALIRQRLCTARWHVCPENTTVWGLLLLSCSFSRGRS